MKNPTSYISISESTAIKGLLIFLIVLGHNMIFTYYALPFRGMEYLYCFHIQAFFILPFLYDSKPLTKNRIKNYFIRLYWPFILLSLPLFFINIIINKNGSSLYDLAIMWVTGNPELIKKCCGIQIFWFMPAMFALSIIKDYYYQASKWIRILLFLVSIYLFFIRYQTSDSLFYIEMNSHLSYFPLGLYIGIPYLFLGIITRAIISKLINTQHQLKLLFLFLFFLCSIIYFYFISIHNNEYILLYLKFIMPCIFVIVIWSYRTYLSEMSVFDKLGSKSYAIYLIHPFIGYFTFFLFLKYKLELSFWLVVVSQLVIISISYFLAAKLYDYPKLRMIILPKTMSEIKSTFNLTAIQHK